MLTDIYMFMVINILSPFKIRKYADQYRKREPWPRSYDIWIFIRLWIYSFDL